jgi:hypothetical protein
MLIGVLLALVPARPALAQTPRPERPYRGVFAGGTQDAQQLLTFGASFAAGYDTNVLARDTSISGVSNALTGRRSRFSQASADLSYAFSSERGSFGATASSSASDYPALRNPLISRYSGGFGGSMQLARRTRVSGNQTLSYQPLYGLSNFPGLFEQPFGQPATVDESLGAQLEKHTTSEANLALDQTLTRRVSLSASYGYRRDRSALHDRDLSLQTATGGVHIGLVKGLGLRLGYGSSQGRYGDAEGPSVQGNNIDAGLDFDRALSVSRRMTLSFSSGVIGTKYQDQTHYDAIGNVHLNREIGRSWNAAVVYSRNVSVFETFLKPVRSDSLNFGVGGLVNRHVTFGSNVGVAVGNVGFSPDGAQFTTYYTTTNLMVAASRFVRVGVTYAYYHYVFGSAVELPSGLSPQTDRQSVRASVTLWAPLVQRNRRHDASR